MPRIALAVVMSLFLAACGRDADGPAPVTAVAPSAPAVVGPGPTAEGAVGARATVEAYLVAAKKPDEAAMLALGTPEWQTKEKTWRKAFTLHIVKSGVKLKTYEIQGPEVEGDKATAFVRAVFDENGKDIGQGMRFSLERRDGRWWITELS